MSDRLTFEQTLKFIERGIIENYTTHICLDKLSRNRLDEWYINNIKIDEPNQKVYFDVIRLNDVRRNNRDTQWVPHTLIKEIGSMSIDKILEAYDMSENNRIEEIDIETDVENEVIGKESAEIDGIELIEGKRFIFLNDKNIKYNNRIYTVKFEDDVIKLVANRGRPKKIRE